MKRKKLKRPFLLALLIICITLAMMPMNVFAYTPYGEVKELKMESSMPDKHEVTYTDIFKGIEGERPDTSDSTAFLKAAVENNNNQYYWAQLAYQIFKSTPHSYWDHAGDGFDTDFGGHYMDLIQGLNGDLAYATSLAEVQDQAMNKLAKNLGRKITKNGFHKYNDIPALADTKKQDVFYTLVSNVDREGKTPKFYYNLFGLAFYDFELSYIDVPEINTAVGDRTFDESVADQKNIPGFSYEQSVKNSLSNYSINKSIQDTSAVFTTGTTKTQSYNTQVTNSEQYSLGESLVGTAKGTGKVPLLAEGSYALSVGVTAAQMFESAFSSGHTEEEAYTATREDSVNVPAHTIVNAVQESGVGSKVVSYDAPVCINFKVAIFSMNGECYDDNALIQSFSTAGYSQYSFLTVFGNGGDVYNENASDNLYNRAIKYKDQKGYDKGHGLSYLSEHDNKEQNVLIDWNKMLSQGTTRTKDLGQLSEEENKAHPKNGNRTTSEILTEIAYKYPMSVTGATVTETSKSSTTTIEDPIPIYPLAKTTLPLETSRTYELTAGDGEKLLSNIFVQGLNKDLVPFHGFMRTAGYWKIRENGDDSQNPVISLKTDPANGQPSVKGLREGTAYIQYCINDGVYSYYDVGKNKSFPVKNEDIKDPLILKINVTGTAFKGTVEAEGQATVYVGDDPIKISDLDTISAGIYDASGRELPGELIWEQKELPEKGILVENNKVSATKPGNFHIRATYEGSFSDWIPVSALNANIETLPIEEEEIDCVDFDKHINVDDTVLPEDKDEKMEGIPFVTRGSYTEFLGEMTELLTGKTPSEPIEKSFLDVDYTQDYGKYVEHALDMGLVLGDGNGNFRPEEVLTTEEMKIIMSRYVNLLDRILPNDYVFTLDENVKQALETYSEGMHRIYGTEVLDLSGRDSATKKEVISFLTPTFSK